MKYVVNSALSSIVNKKTTLRSGFFFNDTFWEATLVYDESIDHLLSNKEIKFQGYQLSVFYPAWLLSR